MYILIFLLIATPCFAFTKDNTIKRAEKPYRYEYQGQKDRYSEELLRNDPEVLVSTPNEKQEITIVANEVAKPEEVIVKTCWDFGSGCEPKE